LLPYIKAFNPAEQLIADQPQLIGGVAPPNRAGFEDSMQSKASIDSDKRGEEKVKMH